MVVSTLFTGLFIINAFSLDSKYQVTPEVLIANNRNDVIVFINGKEYGTFMSKKICLPAGKYKIIGKRRNCFPDYETVTIDTTAVKLVTLAPRPYQIHISPRLALIFVGDTYANLGASFNIGYRRLRNYVGVNVFYTMDQEFINFGLNYNFILFENQFFISETGVLVGYTRFFQAGDALFYETHQDYYYYQKNPDKKKRFRAFSAGPRILAQLGLEHVKLCITYSLLFSKELIQSVEAGLTFNF